MVSADPEKPPLSLFILYELIKKQYKVLGTSYVHSSVMAVDPRLTGAILNGSQVTRGSHQIALSLIWKKGNVFFLFCMCMFVYVKLTLYLFSHPLKQGYMGIWFYFRLFIRMLI